MMITPGTVSTSDVPSERHAETSEGSQLQIDTGFADDLAEVVATMDAESEAGEPLDVEGSGELVPLIPIEIPPTMAAGVVPVESKTIRAGGVQMSGTQLKSTNELKELTVPLQTSLPEVERTNKSVDIELQTPESGFAPVQELAEGSAPSNLGDSGDPTNLAQTETRGELKQEGDAAYPRSVEEPKLVKAHLERLSRTLEQVQHPSSIRMRLDPAELGEVTVSIRQRGGMLTIALSALDDRALWALPQVASDIQKQLAATGVEVEVSVSSESSEDDVASEFQDEQDAKQEFEQQEFERGENDDESR